MRIEPEISAVQLVLVGSLNPTIFNPSWLRVNGLINEAEHRSAELKIVHQELASFTAGNFSITVSPNRFSVLLTQGPWVEGLDFVSRVFGDVLTHTPLTAFGVNRMVHFRVETEDERNKIGRLLAPLEPWGDWGVELEKAKLRAGMQKIVMREPWSDGDFAGNFSVTVEPSLRLEGSNGIYVHANDHCELAKDPGVDGTSKLIKFLTARFENAIQKSESIIDHIMSLRDRTP